MGFEHCECGTLITAMKQIKNGDAIYFYCIRCQLYFDSNYQKLSKQEFEQRKKLDEDLFEQRKKLTEALLELIKKIKESSFPFTQAELLKKNNHSIYFFFKYYPRKRHCNTEQFKQTSHILAIKNNYNYAVEKILPLLRMTIRNDIEIIICVIPSSNKGLEETSIRKIAKNICGINRLDGTSCLVRKYTVPKKHLNGKRNISDEKKSISVENKHIIKDKIIVLLDDITTTGTSMKACTELLLEADAKKVFGLAIAQTVSY
jgi:predicted amidophosphoribosyltransferase